MEKTIPAMPAQTRYRQLDSLRGLAAVTVFFTHYIGMKMSLPQFNLLRPSPLGILFNGSAAVILFFVLSGFVLSLPFVDGQKPLKLTAFYTKRVFRLYPAYIFAITLALALKQFVFDKNGLIPYADWIKNFWAWDWNAETPKEVWHTLLMVGPDFNVSHIDPPVWSLVIEMKMSIVLPFFIIIVSRGGLALNIGLMLVMAWFTYEHDAWAISVFYSGILMAKYKDRLINIIKLWGRGMVILVILVSIVLYNNNYEFLKPIRDLKFDSKYMLSNYLMAFGCCAIIITVLARKTIGRFLEHRLFVFFGDISYSFYLIHVPLLLTFGSLISNRLVFSPVCIFLLAFVSTVLFSYLMNIFIEKPFQKLAIRLIGKYKVLNSLTL